MKYIHYFVIIRLYSFQSFRWISFSYFTDFVGFCFRFVSFLFVSFLSLPVPNLEWELLKNVEIRKSKYARITHSIRGPPFREFCLYQEKSHIFSSENCAVYQKISFFRQSHCTQSTLIVWYFVSNKHYFIEQKRGKKIYVIFLVLGKLLKRWIPWWSACAPPH